MDTFEEALTMARLRRRLPEPELRRMIRKRAGLTQAAVAEEVGCSRVEITLFESGRRNPGRRLLPVYLAVLDRLSEELVGDV